MTLMDETLRRAHAALKLNVLDLIPLLAPSRDRRHAADVAKVVAELDAAVERLIAERERAPGDQPKDLLARLIAAKDSETGARLSAREVRDEVVTIFVAGHETTAMAMVWAWYLLALHPEAEARLHAELAAVLGGRTPVHEDLAKLAYTRAVMDEAMRLYPPVPGLSGRQAIAADEVCGRPVAPGTVMVISPWVLHRHRKLWDAPDRFEPERFLDGRSAGRSRFAYLPFGAGQRVCIGAALATNETMLILATLAQKYRARLVDGQDIDLQQRVTLRPRYGMKMTLERR
jgi:cytochrome P450